MNLDNDKRKMEIENCVKYTPEVKQINHPAGESLMKRTDNLSHQSFLNIAVDKPKRENTRKTLKKST